MGMPLAKLSLEGCRQIEDYELEVLKDLPLTDLNVSECKMTIFGLKVLVGMPLTSLSMRECPLMEDWGLKYLRGLPLISLSLQGCECIEGWGLEHIMDIPLQKLNISYTNISSSDMEDFEVRRSSITELDILYCHEFELEWVPSMHSITSLGWAKDDFWEDDSNPLECLQGKPLTRLNLGGTKFLTDEWLECLRGMPLKELILNGCSGLTTDCVGVLQSLSHLRFLCLPNSSPKWCAASEELRTNDKLSVRLGRFGE